VDTIAKVAELDNIIAIKEANPNLDKVSQIMKKLESVDSEFRIISGNDNLTLPMISLGSKGVISVLANVDPARMSKLVQYALNGNYTEAMRIHYELYDLMKVLFIESNPVPTKVALNLMNRPAGHVRMPLGSLKEENKNKLQKVLQDLKLL
jgi:4-hydroxy-tetrahydrodipicolinate synthase